MGKKCEKMQAVTKRTDSLDEEIVIMGSLVRGLFKMLNENDADEEDMRAIGYQWEKIEALLHKYDLYYNLNNMIDKSLNNEQAESKAA